MIHPLVNLLRRLSPQPLQPLLRPSTLLHPNQTLQTPEETLHDVPRPLFPQPQLRLLQPITRKHILMHIHQPQAPPNLLSPRIPPIPHHDPNHRLRSRRGTKRLQAIIDLPARGSRRPRDGVVQGKIARINPLQPPARFEQRRDVLHAMGPFRAGGGAADEADGHHVVRSDLGGGEGAVHVLDSERDIPRAGLRRWEAGGGDVVACELGGGAEGFGDVEEPDAGAGADVCYLGGRGDGDAWVDEEAEGFGCEDVLLVESVRLAVSFKGKED